ncbi:MAG: hypothetical protein KDE15_08870, partial [Erythrobacter sp.]|nr:hypothetical protein [Erythrobacter sp.]
MEKGDEFRLAFREEPTQSIPLADQQVISEFDALQKRMWDLFEKGQSPMENARKGYLDYEDPQVSQMVQTLVAEFPPKC